MQQEVVTLRLELEPLMAVPQAHLEQQKEQDRKQDREQDREQD